MTIEVDKKLVKHVSSLARIEIKESELADYEKNFKDIIGYVDSLLSVDVSNAEPLFTPLSEYKENFVDDFKKREDEIATSLNVKQVLKNAPDQKNNQFKISAVIEEE